LVPARLPTRYPFPGHVLDPRSQSAVDTEAELGGIFAKSPEFVVVRTSRLGAYDEIHPLLGRYLRAAYTRDSVFAEHEANRSKLVEVLRLSAALGMTPKPEN